MLFEIIWENNICNNVVLKGQADLSANTGTLAEGFQKEKSEPKMRICDHGGERNTKFQLPSDKLSINYLPVVPGSP